jgi:hypothetical protein
MYVFKQQCQEHDTACQQNQADFEKSFNDLKSAQATLRLMGEDYAAAQLQDVINAYGEKGDGRSTIDFSNNVQGGKDAEVNATAYDKNGKATHLDITFKPGAAADAGLVGHEGTHGADMRDGSYSKMTLFQREYRAYQTQAFWAQAHYGDTAAYGRIFGAEPNGLVRQATLWNPSWSKTDLVSAPLLRSLGIRTWIANGYPQAKPIEPADPKR